MYGDLAFRTYALYLLWHEEKLIIDTIEALASNKLHVSSKITRSILETLKQQLNAQDCGYWINTQLFDIGGEIILDGIAVEERRLFLELRIPVLKKNGTGADNKDDLCTQGDAGSGTVNITQEVTLGKLYQMSQGQKLLEKSNNEELGQLSIDIKKVNDRIQQLEVAAEKVLNSTRNLTWMPIWLNYTHLALFVLALVAIIILRKFFPEWWVPKRPLIRRADWLTMNSVSTLNPAFELT